MKSVHLAQIWNKLHNLAVMVALQIAPRTRTKLVEASQLHYQLTQCLLPPSSMLTDCDVTYFTFCASPLVAVTTLWPPKGQEDCSCAPQCPLTMR